MSKSTLSLLFVTCLSVLCSSPTAVNAESSNPQLGTYVPAWYIWRTEGAQLTDKTQYGTAGYVYLAFMFLGDGREATQWKVEVPNANPYTLTFHEESGQEIVKWIRNNTNAKIMLSIGGWTHETRGLSTLLTSPTAETIFINSLKKLMQNNDIQGIDWNWEYPGDTTRGGQYGDNYLFPQLIARVGTKIKELYPYFEQHVTVGIHPKHKYQIEDILSVADRVNLMTYDMYGNWNQSVIYHHTPWINEHEKIGFSISEAIERWSINENATKLSVGFANYGRGQGCSSFKECKTKMPGIPSQQLSPYTQEVGVIDYYEVLDLLEKGKMILLGAKYDTISHNVEIIVTYKGKSYDILWFSLDDENTLCVKTQLATNTYNIRNYFFWHLLGDRDNELEASVTFGMNYPNMVCPKMEKFMQYPKTPPAFKKYLFDRDNCSVTPEEYTECIQGKLCPEGVYFNKDHECESDRNNLTYNCKDHVTEVCSLIPVKDNSQKFIACAFNKEYILECPSTLWFDHENCVCTYR